MKSMMRKLLVLSGVVLAIGTTVRTSGAQCAFPHPDGAKKLTLSLVQALVPCNVGVCIDTDGYDGLTCASDEECQLLSAGGSCYRWRPPNSHTQGGVPSCKPPYTAATFNETNGDPPNAPPLDGWRWGPRSSGRVSFAAKTTPFPNTADVEVKVDVRGIEDADGPIAEGFGTLLVTARFTAESRTVDGDMTVVDVPIAFNVQVRSGRAKVKTSFNEFLEGAGQPMLPGCTSLHLVDVVLQDGNGTPFGVPGIFLPDLPN